MFSFCYFDNAGKTIKYVKQVEKQIKNGEIGDQEINRARSLAKYIIECLYKKLLERTRTKKKKTIHLY